MRCWCCCCWLSLRRANGGELFDRIIERQRFTEDETKFFFRQLFQAIKYLHANGVVHRDLKAGPHCTPACRDAAQPENILLADGTMDAVVKVTDFGLAKLVGPQSFMKTMCGTPDYLAPEVLKTGMMKGLDAVCTRPPRRASRACSRATDRPWTCGVSASFSTFGASGLRRACRVTAPACPARRRSPARSRTTASRWPSRLSAPPSPSRATSGPPSPSPVRLVSVHAPHTPHSQGSDPPAAGSRPGAAPWRRRRAEPHLDERARAAAPAAAHTCLLQDPEIIAKADRIVAAHEKTIQRPESAPAFARPCHSQPADCTSSAKPVPVLATGQSLALAAINLHEHDSDSNDAAPFRSKRAKK